MQHSRLTNIDPGALLTFLLVAEEGNLTRAAERRHTTPSAASAQLRLLEDRLGICLFSRSRRGMELTPEGKALIDPVKRAIEGLGIILQTADNLRGGIRGSVRLGLNAAPEFLKLTQLLARMRDQAPEVDLSVSTSMSGRIVPQVAAGALDAGFIFANRPPKGLESLFLSDVEVRAVAPAGWPHTRLPEDGPSLAALPWIEPDGECPFLELFSAFLGEWQSKATIAMRSDGEATTLALVKAGMGIGFLERYYADAAIRDGQIVELSPAFSVGLYLVLPPNDRIHARHALLKSIVREVWLPQDAQRSVKRLDHDVVDA